MEEERNLKKRRERGWEKGENMLKKGEEGRMGKGSRRATNVREEEQAKWKKDKPVERKARIESRGNRWGGRWRVKVKEGKGRVGWRRVKVREGSEGKRDGRR